MKILHICLTGGYTEGFTYQENLLIKYQARQNNDVYLISTEYCWNKNIWAKSSETDYINKDGVRIIRIPYVFKFPYKINSYLGYFKYLNKHLNNIQPDVIFIHNIQFKDIKVIAQYAKKHSNTRIYVDNHSDFSNSARNIISKFVLYKLWWKRCAKTINPYVEKFYGVLPARVDFLKEVYGLPENKCELLVMGADDDYVKKYTNTTMIKKLRKDYNIEDDDFVIVTGGKIDRFKLQTLTLMEYINSCQNDKIKLFVFGSIEKEVKDRFDSLLSDKINYLGWANEEQSYKYFSIADLVVFPGRHSVYWEQVVAMGIPMVCKYWNGTTHVDIGNNVVFIKNDDDLGKIITKIIENRDYYNLLKKNALKDQKNNFLYSFIAQKSVQKGK